MLKFMDRICECEAPLEWIGDRSDYTTLSFLDVKFVNNEWTFLNPFKKLLDKIDIEIIRCVRLTDGWGSRTHNT